MTSNNNTLKCCVCSHLSTIVALRPPFCTLTTYSWLNWVDEDDWWGWGWLERKARRHYLHQTDHIEIRPESPGVRAKDFIPTCYYWELQTRECAGAFHLKAPRGEIKFRPGGVYNWLFNFCSPPDTRRRCSKFFNLKRVDSLLLP